MSILKGILHHFNKTSNAYDTIHPETESAQVTDWNSGIVGTLASTALGSLVTTLSSDSLLAKLIEKVLSATGVKYQSGQNGYLCHGSLFGGIIIQWGLLETDQYGNAWITFPVSFNLMQPTVIAMHYGTNQVVCFNQSASLNKTSAEISMRMLDGTVDKGWGCAWVAIGY